MIEIEFDKVDDAVFPLEEVRCEDGEFVTAGYVELAGFRNHRGSARFRLILRVTEAFDYDWDPKDGDGSLILDRFTIGEGEVRFLGVIPGELTVATRAIPKIQFQIEEFPFQERRWFRWVSLSDGDNV